MSKEGGSEKQNLHQGLREEYNCHYITFFFFI